MATAPSTGSPTAPSPRGTSPSPTTPSAPSPTTVTPPPSVAPPVAPTGPAANRTTALDALIAMFAAYGLQDLAKQVGDLAADPSLTDSEKFVQVYQLPAYKERFPAMDALQKQGNAINEATYIAQEQSYRQVLQQAGLPPGFYDSRQDYAKWMLGGVSAAELNDRIGKAQQIVDTADPSFTQPLQDYYGLDRDHLLAYVIDPEKAKPLIDKQIQAVQAGAAANRYGFQVDRTAAEAIATNPLTQGMDQSQLSQGFGKARTLADQDLRLSSIEGAQYDQKDAIDAVLNDNYQKQLESQRRAQRETARFSEQSGVSSGSLKSPNGL